MLATKFIIALCPAARIYLAGNLDIKGSVSTDKSKALVFDTFDAAMEVCKGITGWGGAQRVEEIAVNVPAPAPWQRVESLATEDTCNEVRDAATFVWNETLESSEPQSRAVEEVKQAMQELGLKVSAEVRAGASSPVTLYLADYLGNTLQLDFDPMVDGFDITEATTAADAKPRTAVCDCCARRRPQSMVHTFEDTHDDGTSTSTACEDCIVDAPAEPDHGCAGNCKPLSTKAARALRKWGMDKCQRAWHLNRLRGEGLTVCSIETGIPLRSVDSAINAWQEVWEQLFPPQTCSETATCDGCGATDAEPCGDPEGFAFCAACRAKDANAPRE